MTIKQWLAKFSEMLVNDYGIDKSFSENIATFYLYLKQYNLNPVITSGYRSENYQKELSNRFFSGDRSIVVKPAIDSLHTKTKFGKPASLAIDISTSNPSLAAQIASALKIGAGYYFKTSDRVHYYA
jgi:hypothetical protein